MLEDLPDALKALASGVSDAVAALLPPADADLRGRLDEAIGEALHRLELVPREEYERQIAAVRRLEGEIARLESRLAALESRER